MLNALTTIQLAPCVNTHYSSYFLICGPVLPTHKFRHDVHLDHLSVNGRIRFNGSGRISLTHCQIQTSATQFNGDGIVTYFRSENAYIADNVIVGTTAWQEDAMGAIEADFCQHNCRVLHNRATNSFIAFSSQLSLGGRTWFIRNVAYNVAHVAFKLYRGSSGDVLLHNTIIKAGDAYSMYTGDTINRVYSRNNLIIGGPGNVINGFSNGNGRVTQINALNVSTADMDYDALGSITGLFTGEFGPSINFSNLSEMQAMTTETHGIEIDMSVFEEQINFPSDPLTQFTNIDLRLNAIGDAVDQALPLANINDDFTSTGPDMGAYEAGQTLPPYGPRTGPLFQDGFEEVN